MLTKSYSFVVKEIMSHISVVVPVYKAEDCMHELYQRLLASLTTITQDFEIVLVEDCGGDASWDKICEIAQLDRRVKGIQFSRNFGQHFGITAGLDHCDGDWVVVMDCDLQDRPEEIPRLYRKAQEGYHVVMAVRKNRKDAWNKRLSSWLFYKTLNYFSGMHYDSRIGNYRIVSRQVVNQFRLLREQLRFFGGMVDWLGFPAAAIEVEHAERFAGKTSYTFRKLWRLATDVIIAYSDKPLRLSIGIGFTMACMAFVYGIYILLRALFCGVAVLGWSSLIVSLYLLGGFIIFNLGIIGIYLGKIFNQTKNRPLYVIRRKTFGG